VKIFPGALHALNELHSDPRFEATLVACASSTTHASYAVQCLQMLEVCEGGPKLADLMTFQEIYPAVKTKHFRKLQSLSGIEYSDMLFFDDCGWGANDRDVERGCPGVVTTRTPNGMTVAEWEQGLRKFATAAAKRS
jgi:magnesium-dependent phosphatase 1